MSDADRAEVPGLRLLVVGLLVLTFVLPVALVAVGGRWLPCTLLSVVIFLAAAAVSVHADSVEKR